MTPPSVGPNTSARPWLRIAVTGGIACGKSLAGSFLRAFGVPVIEADDLGHGFLRADTPTGRQVAAAFGPDILDGQGAIDRARLGALVFAPGGAHARARLEAILHPAVREAIAAWLQARRREAESGAAAGWRGGAAAVIPLLYEVGWESDWDCVICVAAPAAVQGERLRGRGLSDAEAHARLAAQWPVEEKMKRADIVVFNAGPADGLRRQIDWVMRQLKA